MGRHEAARGEWRAAAVLLAMLPWLTLACTRSQEPPTLRERLVGAWRADLSSPYWREEPSTKYLGAELEFFRDGTVRIVIAYESKPRSDLDQPLEYYGRWSLVDGQRIKYEDTSRPGVYVAPLLLNGDRLEIPDEGGPIRGAYLRAGATG